MSVIRDVVLFNSRCNWCYLKVATKDVCICRFYMPHGLHIDSKGNIWVTDVAMHQVMRFPKIDSEPTLILGIKFESGSDDTHFCKPSDVAVTETGDFYITDGYV